MVFRASVPGIPKMAWACRPYSIEPLMAGGREAIVSCLCKVHCMSHNQTQETCNCNSEPYIPTDNLRPGPTTSLKNLTSLTLSDSVCYWLPPLYTLISFPQDDITTLTKSQIENPWLMSPLETVGGTSARQAERIRRIAADVYWHTP